MKKQGVPILWFILIALIYYIIGIGHGGRITRSKMETEAVAAGAARYHPVTMEFEYINSNEKRTNKVEINGKPPKEAINELENPK